jgi:hypothetical protein
LDNLQKDMQVVSSNRQLEPRIIRDQLTNYIAGMEIRHKNDLSILDELDTAISNAPQRRGLFDFKIK